MNRRDFLRASLAAPAVILTPNLLMPVKGIITDAEALSDLLKLYHEAVLSNQQYIEAKNEMVKHQKEINKTFSDLIVTMRSPESYHII